MADISVWAGIDQLMVHFDGNSCAPIFPEVISRPDGDADSKPNEKNTQISDFRKIRDEASSQPTRLQPWSEHNGEGNDNRCEYGQACSGGLSPLVWPDTIGADRPIGEKD